MDYDDFYTPVYIHNARHNTTQILIIVFSSIAGFIALTIIIIVCCCCCKKSQKIIVNIDYPTISENNLFPGDAKPDPDSNPNQQDEQIPKNQPESDIWINNDTKVK